MIETVRRFPAEWEEQDGVLMAWPHEGTDWVNLHAVQRVTIDIAREITRFERLLMVAPDIEEARRSMADAGLSLDRVRFSGSKPMIPGQGILVLSLSLKARGR